MELSAYISADFLGAGLTSSATQTNSYAPRLRQAWAQAKFSNGWKVLGGQMWSLVTENKVGIAPSDDAGKVNDARPATIDPQYQVGFSFARQYGLRLTKDFGQTVSVAFAIENAQGSLTTHSNDGNYLLGEAGANNSYNTTANYTANPAPDLIAKIAFDPGFGHYEIFGLADRFTDRVFPCYQYTSPNCALSSTLTAPSVAGAYNASKEGGGFGANARWMFADKHVVFGLHGFGGSGIQEFSGASHPGVARQETRRLRLRRSGVRWPDIWLRSLFGGADDNDNGNHRTRGGYYYYYVSNRTRVRRLRSSPLQQCWLLHRNAARYWHNLGRHNQRRIRSRRSRQMHQRHTSGDRGYGRLLVPLLQRAQGQVPVRHAVLLCDAADLVWRRRDRNFRVTLRTGQHGLHFIPLLFAVNRKWSRVGV